MRELMRSLKNWERSEMNVIVQWATILSPIVAVVLAWLTSRSSAKAATRQIAIMQENTEKEIKILKELAELQIEALSLEIEMEMAKNRIIVQQAAEERSAMKQILDIHLLDFRDLALQEYQGKQPERNHKYLTAYLVELDRLNKKLSQVKQHFN